MKIAIDGTYYVGLSNGALLAQHNEVVCLDIVPDTYADVTDLVKQFDFKPNNPVKRGVANFVTWHRDFSP